MRQPVPFGRYLLLDRVSVGGMAEIFKAKSYGVEGFEKIIAIKRILPSMGEDSEFIKMFIDEAKIVGQLAHANICQIFELGRIEGIHFIAMEYIWGKDLLQLQNRLKKLDAIMPPAMACHVVARACEGLDYAHRKRDPLGNDLMIVHRDCSPQNVLVSYEGEVKIIDFGIAKASLRTSRTMAGVLKGKFGYMSPEQVRGLPLDRRSDIFALGTVLYELLTRERLFQAESDFSTLEKVRNVAIEPPRVINPDIPQAVEDIVMKALAPDPDARYQWCSEMLGDLQRFLMSQEQVFTSKSLSSWMKENFAAELRRERKLMEEYKKLGRDGQVAAAPPAEPIVDVAEPIVDVAEVAELDEVGDDDTDDPTMLGGPSFEHILGKQPTDDSPSMTTIDEELDDDLSASAHQDFGEDVPTEIFGEVVTDEAAESELRHLSEPVGASEAPSVEAPALLEAGPVPGTSGSQAQTLLQPSGSAAVREASAAISAVSGGFPPGPGGIYAHTGNHQQLPGAAPSHLGHPGGVHPSGMYPANSPWGSTASVASLAPSQATRGGRPSLLKDVLIGVAIAVLALVVVVAVKYLFFPTPSNPEPGPQLLGSVSISVPSGRRAMLQIDGRRVGEVVGGAPLVVSDLTLGTHTIEISAEGAKPCRGTVTLDDTNVAGDISCPLEPLRTQLILEGVSPEFDIQVDGQSVPEEQRTGPLELEPGTLHDIAIKRGDETLDQFTVTLEPGETVRRALRVTDPESETDDADGDGDGNDDDDDRRRTRRADRDDRDDDSDSRRRRRDRDDDKDEKQVGYLLANSSPWAKVIIDGKDTGLMTPIAPRSKIPLSPGKHRVTFEYKGKRYDYSIVIEAGQTAKLIKNLPVGD